MDKIVKHYKTPEKPLAAPLLDSIIQMLTNAEEKEATDIHEDVGEINIDMTLVVVCDDRGEVAVAKIVEMIDKKNDDDVNVAVATIVETDDELDEDGNFRYDNANCCYTHDPSKPCQPISTKFRRYICTST